MREQASYASRNFRRAHGCEGDTTCTCTTDGVETSSCEAAAICDGPGIERLAAKAKECCGF